jgi:hypothetical protein
VSLALLAGFLMLALLGGMGLHELLMHLAAGASLLVIAFACFAFGWIGGGDAKVASAAALWFGFPHLVNYLLYASLFGGALTLLLLQFRQWPLPPAGRTAMAHKAACQGERNSLRHRARDRRLDDLSGDRLGEGDRSRAFRHAVEFCSRCVHRCHPKRARTSEDGNRHAFRSHMRRRTRGKQRETFAGTLLGGTVSTRC